MSGIDQRVVEMQFDNKAFGSGIKTSLDDLDNLKKGLKLDGATAGLENVTAAANKFSLHSIGTAVDGIAQKFSAMSIVGITAISNLANKVVNSAEQMAKSLTIAPVSSGFQEYELKMGSIQTILANTSRYGTSLETVNAELDKLNHYADQTIYNFGDMTKNIGLFTNAGIRVEDATTMIKGFSNAAAASGTSAEGASNAAYQLSQALSAGKITAQDWISLTNVGMGNKNMQEGLLTLAKDMGTFKGTGTDATKAAVNFKGSLEKGWLTTDVMSKYLKIMSGDMTDAEYAALHLTDAQVALFKQQAQTGLDSAQKVRTFTQLVGTLREAVGSGWSESFGILFGDFNEATDLFTGLSNGIGGILNASSDARNKVLADWDALGGRTTLIEGLKAAWQALSGVLGPIHDAFREIFPAKTGQDLMNMTTAFTNFMKSLVPGQKTMDNIKRTFAGFFAILSIGWQIIKAGFGFITELIGHFSKGTGGILDFTGGVGDFLVKIDAALKKGDVFGKFFGFLAKVVEGPIDGLKHIVGYIADLVKAIASAQAVQGILDRLKSNFGEIADAGDKVGGAWDRAKIIFGAMWDAIHPIVTKIGEIFKGIGSGVASFLGSISFTDLVAGAGIAGFLILIKKIQGTIDKFLNPKNEGPSIFARIKTSLDQLTGTLKTMQNTLRATMILEIAAAIGILAIAVNVLSKIDAGGLARATSAIAVMIVELTGAMILMDKMLKKAKGVKLAIIAAGMILLAIAIDILASAATKLADLNWNELAKGLTGVVVLLVAVAGAMKLMPSQSKMVSTGIGLVLLASAIKILVTAVKDIADMSWADIAKGMTGVAALLLALGLYTKFAGMGSVGDGLGLLLLAAAIKVLASAMKDISDLSWQEIAKGLVGMAGGLVAIVAALKLMPQKSILNAAAILIVAASLKMIGNAMEDMSKLSWEDIAKGVVTLGGALAAIAIALKLMPESSILNAASILIVALALGKIGDALQELGNMSWEEIAKSLVALAGALLIIVVAVNAMEVAIPGALALIIVAYSLKLLADAMVVMGGMSWSDIAAALVVLAAALTIIVIAVNAMEIALPGAAALIVVAFALKILADVMTKLGDMSWSDIGAAIGGLTLLFVVLAVGGALSPLILALAAALTVLAVAVALIGGGVYLAGQGVESFAIGLKMLSEISPEGLDNITNAIQRLIDLLPEMATALADAIANFVVELGNRTPEMAEAAGKAIEAMVTEFRDRTPHIVAAFMDGVTATLNAMADRAPDMIQAGSDLIVNTLDGITQNMPRIAESAANLISAFLTELGNNTQKVVDAGFKMIIDVMNGIAQAIRDNAAQIKAAAANIGSAIIDGITGAVDKGSPGLNAKIGGMAGGLLQHARDVLGIKSPSKKFAEIGKYVVEGFAIGLTGNKDKIDSAVQDMMGKFDDAMQAELDDIQKHNDKIADLVEQRGKNAQDMADASAALRDAQNIKINPSKAKTRAARNEDIAKQQDAKNKKIDAANKKLQELTAKQQDYNDAIWHEQIAINADSDEYNRLNNARYALQVNLAGETILLEDLANQRDANNQALDDEIKILDDATKTRDDYNRSLRDQYGAQESISKDTHLTDYLDRLRTQIVDTQQFSIAIQELRKNGLNDELYKQLLASGPDTMPFLQELLAGGQSALDDINSLGSALDVAAGVLGDTASTSLYQAGVDAAAGLVQGLLAHQDEIQAQMDQIAKTMIDAINRELGIQSPSKVMAQVGSYAAQGLAKGLDDSAGMIGRASAGVGQSAIDSMKKSISGLGSLVSESMDVNPTISPVLDLTQVKKEASAIGSLLSAPALSVGAVYSRASDAAAGYAASQAAMLEALAPGEMPAPLTFIQNNSSPKALSQAEIYRQTKNQLSVAKGALTSNAN